MGLSIDGIRAVHDANPIDADGHGTWKGVLAARTLLERFSVPCNALCVVTASCAEQPEAVYRSLKNLGFRYQQFIACLDPMGKPRGGETWSLTPERYGAFLCRLFDLWYRDWKTGNYHSIRLFDDYIHILLGEPASTCGSCKNDWVTDEAGTRNYYCKSFRALFDHAMPRMLEIARAERMARKQ